MREETNDVECHYNVGEKRVEPAIKQFLPPLQKQCPVNEDIQRTNVLISPAAGRSGAGQRRIDTEW